MPNCANTAEFRVGRSADVLYVQFHAHVISDVKTKISGRRRKTYFTATDRDGSRFADWKGLRRWAQEEGLCFIIVKFKFVFQHPGLDVWQTGFQRRYCRLMERQRLGAEYRPRKIETQSSDTESSQKEVLCRGWRELGPIQNLVALHRKDLRLVRCGHRRWLTVFYLSDRRKPGECSTGDAIHVLESVKKYAVVDCVKGS